MAALGLYKASMISVSLGARVGVRFGVSDPQMVDRLELLSPSGLLFDRQTMQSTRAIARLSL